MRVLIVDDEPLARTAVRLLVEHDPELSVAGECSGVDAVAAIQSLKPDILFLDIQMPEVDGFDVLETIGVDGVPAVVFVTAYDQYAVRAFDVHAIDYLVKPFDDRRFFAALLRAKDRARQRARGKEYVSRYLVRVRDKVVLVKTADVDWIEAADYYVTLHAGPESYLLRRSLAEIEAELDPRQFIRVHRSAIVNIDRVKEMHSLFRGDSLIVLRDGTNVRLSRARREEFERRLKEPRSVF